MVIIRNTEFKFTYNQSKSVDENFIKWRILNHEERSAWGDDLLTQEESRQVFESMYSVKVSVDK
jgi:hypothetical protein